VKRREFISASALATTTAALGKPTTAKASRRMGLTIWSYNIRWRKRSPSGRKPGWRNALDVLDHCKDLGAGCLQIGVQGWQKDFIKQVRDKRERLGISLEGQIGLPRNKEELGRFETELLGAREAGATILRTVCLNGRRYEKFGDKDAWDDFRKESLADLQRAEPIAAKRKVKLAVENHKDWRADEQIAILKRLDSEWIGVNLDFGNNFALLEHAHAVAEALAPYLMTTHLKDMAMAEYADGFLLSEVPLGEGVLDLQHMMKVCQKANPEVWFNLEMITRDPLRVPVFKDRYWATMDQLPAADLAGSLKLAKDGDADALPKTRGRTDAGKLKFEDDNVRQSFEYGRKALGFS
jgi:sugar phosphate isomerase/epimerase